MHTDTPTAGPALDLAWFGVGLAVSLVVHPVVRGLPRMLVHACRHEGDLAWLAGRGHP